MGLQVATYQLAEDVNVRFEIDPPNDWQDVSADKVMGQIRDAVDPAVKGAKVVLDKVRECNPDEVALTFGIKVSGDMNWLIAKAATEANFQVTLTWKKHADAA